MEMSMKSIEGVKLSTTKTMHNCRFHIKVGKNVDDIRMSGVHKTS